MVQQEWAGAGVSGSRNMVLEEHLMATTQQGVCILVGFWFAVLLLQPAISFPFTNWESVTVAGSTVWSVICKDDGVVQVP